MQKITPFLWFDTQAEEAVRFYTSVFKNSKVGAVTRRGEAGPGEPGSVLTVEFELDGLSLVALNGGPHFKFTEAISLQIGCETQGEVDELWTKLTVDGGEPGRCGWLKDRYGLSWQVVPTALLRLLRQPDAEKANRVMAAMMQMTKIEIAALERAAA